MLQDSIFDVGSLTDAVKGVGFKVPGVCIPLA